MKLRKKHPLYQIWQQMRFRTTNPKHAAYKYYGGRGITTCHRWLNSFDCFVDDMGEKPSDKHSIDRRDNDKGYTPENCRWATKTEQARNRRKQSNNASGVCGVGWNKAHGKWQAYIRADCKLIYLGLFTTIDLAAAARKAGELKYWG